MFATCRLSIIIPVLNEQETIATGLALLCKLDGLEVIVVDGGSCDHTVDIARAYTDKVFESGHAGRAVQMNLGASKATGEILLFLHADTRLPARFDTVIFSALQTSRRDWGRFDVQLSGRHRMFRLIEFMINWRSKLSGIATGDQAIFVKKSVFEKLGGFVEIPLMEDISLSNSLKKNSRPVCLAQKVLTSSRRWEQKGIWKTIVLMWRLRLAFFLGVSPHKLVRKYY